MERDLAILGTLIALLRRENIGLNIESQIFNGIRVAKTLSITEALAGEAGKEITHEELIFELNAPVTLTASYQTIASKAIAALRTAELSMIEMACKNYNDYQYITWKITIGTTVKELILPTSLTLAFPNLSLRGGTTIKVEAKTSSGSPEAWADIIGKEIT